jgi:Glycosyl hydrolase family 26
MIKRVALLLVAVSLAAMIARGSGGSSRAVASTTTPSIYWGADIDGNTYSYLYGGTWSNPPWSSVTWNKFESNAGKKISILAWSNSPPWVHDFNYLRNAHELVRSRGDLSLISMTSGGAPLRDIASGKYDSYLKTWSQEVAAWGHPFFLRWDWEMNGKWEPYAPGNNGNTASDYINAWRHFHNIAQQAGASNVNWVWCPNVDPGNIYTPYAQLYPGDAYVDWTCLDGYNKGSLYTPPGWRSFATIYSSSYNALLKLAPTKPIMIGEISSEERGGSKASWITDLLGTQLPHNFPKIKALVWYNHRAFDKSLNYWWPWEIESSSSALSAFKKGIASSYYHAGGSFGNLPLHSKIAPLP